MADKQKDKQQRLERRKFGIRSSLFGTPERPRLSVFRSDKHIYAQLIDDYAGKTLAAVSSRHAEVRGDLKNGGDNPSPQKGGPATAGRGPAGGGAQGGVFPGG